MSDPDVMPYERQPPTFQRALLVSISYREKLTILGRSSVGSSSRFHLVSTGHDQNQSPIESGIHTIRRI
jgi:hypothetical protein